MTNAAVIKTRDRFVRYVPQNTGQVFCANCRVWNKVGAMENFLDTKAPGWATRTHFETNWCGTCVKNYLREELRVSGYNGTPWSIMWDVIRWNFLRRETTDPVVSTSHPIVPAATRRTQTPAILRASQKPRKVRPLEEIDIEA